jgi:hypothetical protein
MTAEIHAHSHQQHERLCPFCRSEISGAVWMCPACQTPHHAGCAEENGRCTVFGCNTPFSRNASTESAASTGTVQLAAAADKLCPICHEVTGPPVWVCTQCFAVHHFYCASTAKRCGGHRCNAPFVDPAEIERPEPGTMPRARPDNSAAQFVMYVAIFLAWVVFQILTHHPRHH